jgi:hypothetical protein
VLSAAGDTETTQENIQDWLELDEGDLGFQPLTEEEIAAVMFLLFISSALPLLLTFPFIYFLSFLFFFKPIFLSNRLCDLVVRVPDYRSRGPRVHSAS